MLREISRLLGNRYPAAVCDQCLASELGRPDAVVASFAAALTFRGFDRRYGNCRDCRRVDIVTKAPQFEQA